MTRDELKAHEWAAIAVEFHAKAEARGHKIPFPDLCFCGSKSYGKGAHPHNNASCPYVSKKTHALRVAALGRLIKEQDAR